MPKIKKKRMPVKIDMTPMVDVAFLLLTFFMLTTSFAPAEEVKIEVPSSHSAFKLPDSNIMMLYIDKNGSIYMGVDQPALMEHLFGKNAGSKKEIQVKVENLTELLVQARMSNPKLRTVVKGDTDADYGTVEDVMNILQKTMITKFSMVTNSIQDKK
ncbi:MAG: biopolymer transporter ExbD [Ignavibacteriaceae bacterium]|jgi:biopolymer transport protein ExbD|nr:biopolymer transporter ExbD [Ignavibacteriaceae bacterium]